MIIAITADIDGYGIAFHRGNDPCTTAQDF
jgi:hypothetical protein